MAVIIATAAPSVEKRNLLIYFSRLLAGSIRNCSRCPVVFITMNICVAIIYMAMLKIIKTYCDIPQ